MSNYALNYSAECDKRKSITKINKNSNDKFFHKIIRKNFFIKPIVYNGNNLSMKNLFKTDYFLLKKKQIHYHFIKCIKKFRKRIKYIYGI